MILIYKLYRFAINSRTKNTLFFYSVITTPIYLFAGRNSQSMSGMTVDSSQTDSDRESFVSRVGSYALTDVGVGTSELVGACPFRTVS